MAAGEVCSVCGGSPVLYYSNKRVFCKAHKAEATARAQRGLNVFKSHASVDQVDIVGGVLYDTPYGHGGTPKQKRFRHHKARK